MAGAMMMTTVQPKAAINADRDGGRQPLRRIILSWIVALVLATSLAAPVMAGQFADAAAAYRRGDYATAFQKFRSLADQGDARAQNNLGLMYDTGRGVQKNYNDAVEWFRRAADQGDANAQTSLGAMYQSGQGVPQDVTAAMKWYRLAADQGFGVAQSNLGAMYLNGLGVPQDFAVAINWYRLAADQGYADAQFALGAFYEDGLGVPEDYVHAYMWFSLAAALYPASEAEIQGQAIKYRNDLGAKMTTEQIAQAQALARQWHATGGR